MKMKMKMTMKMQWLRVCLWLDLWVVCVAVTSIKTYPTIDVRENVPLNSEVIELKSSNGVGRGRWKLILLNLAGFESMYFGLNEENVLQTRHSIDREEFLQAKRCFDRLFCLIELHILVNDGEEYLVIPIHIVE